MNQRTKFLPMRYVPLALAALVVILWPCLSTGTARPYLKGVWEGAIDSPGMKLDITIEFSRGDDDQWNGKIDIPAQGAQDLPLANINLKGVTVTFDLPGVPGDPKFSGSLSGNGDTISGEFNQGGLTMPFSLTRLDVAEMQKKAKELGQSLNKLRAFIDSTMTIWHVPGLAICIVKDGEVILSEGFGMRNIRDSLPVTSQTLFAIGSTTKAFTTVALGMLVDEGKLDWEEPVKTYLPTFEMYDDYVTQEMTPIDLVTHRSGLPRHDLIWYNSSFTRRELFERLRYLQPSKEFRAAFQYQNLMFMTAGYLVGQITGGTWEEFVQERIFAPVGISGSNFSVVESQESPDYALPYDYDEDDDVINEIPFRNISEIGPAGSINSNVEDMAKWVMFHLNKGKVNQTQILSETNMTKMHTPQIVIQGPSEYSERLHTSYGLGWFIESYRGHNMVSHGGGIDGFTAMVSLMLEDNLGVVVLTNLSGTSLPSITPLYAIDLLLGLDPVEWHTRYKTRKDLVKKAKQEAEAKEIDRKAGTKPSHKLAEYTGEYKHAGYGIITIELEKKTLSASYNNLTMPLEHWHYDIFCATIELFEEYKLMFSFQSNMKGDIDRLSIPLENSVDDVIFTRLPSAELSNPEFLSQFVGEYDLAGQTVRFEFKGDSALIVVVPGQPPYELEPYKGTEFLLKGVTGYSVEFRIDSKKGVTQAVFKQPNGVFTAIRKE